MSENQSIPIEQNTEPAVEVPVAVVAPDETAQAAGSGDSPPEGTHQDWRLQPGWRRTVGSAAMRISQFGSRHLSGAVGYTEWVKDAQDAQRRRYGLPPRD